jgi:hypothetical protein
VAKEQGDHEFTVPQADINLEDIPASREKSDAAYEASILDDSLKAKRRARIAYAFNKAKHDGIAAAERFWPPRLFRNAEADEDLARRIKEVLRFAEDTWPDPYSCPSSRVMAREIELRFRRTLGFKAGAIDKILRGKYRAARRLKIGGLR